MMKPYMGRVRVVLLCMLYPDICIITEGKAQKYLSQGSIKVPVGHDSVCSHGCLAGSQEKSIQISFLCGNRVKAWSVNVCQAA
jgi:hypothetical protein